MTIFPKRYLLSSPAVCVSGALGQKLTKNQSEIPWGVWGASEEGGIGGENSFKRLTSLVLETCRFLHSLERGARPLKCTAGTNLGSSRAKEQKHPQAKAQAGAACRREAEQRLLLHRGSIRDWTEASRPCLCPLMGWWHLSLVVRSLGSIYSLLTHDAYCVIRNDMRRDKEIH